MTQNTPHPRHPGSEKRRYKRLPILSRLVRPVMITLPGLKKPVPGIVGDLSAGGLSINTFVEMPVGRDLELTIDLGVFRAEGVAGRVVRLVRRGGAFQIGIEFTGLDRPLADRINRLAEDFDACELRWVRSADEICLSDCTYHPFCTKSVKTNFE